MDTLGREDWYGLSSFARAPSEFAKKPTFDAYVRQLVPGVERFTPKQLEFMWGNGATINRSLVPIKADFVAALKRVHDIAKGYASGDIESARREAARLASLFLSRRYFHSGQPGNDTAPVGHRAVLNPRTAFQQYVLPLLGEGVRPQNNDYFHFQRDAAPPVREPDGTLSKTDRAKDSVAYRSFAAALAKFEAIVNSTDVTPEKLQAAGRSLAEAYTLYRTQTSKTMAKVVDVFRSIISPAIPDLFPNNSFGWQRFSNAIRVGAYKDNPQYVQWANRNRELLEKGYWYAGGAIGADGQPNRFYQALLRNLRFRPNGWNVKKDEASAYSFKMLPDLFRFGIVPQSGGKMLWTREFYGAFRDALNPDAQATGPGKAWARRNAQMLEQARTVPGSQDGSGPDASAFAPLVQNLLAAPRGTAMAEAIKSNSGLAQRAPDNIREPSPYSSPWRPGLRKLRPPTTAPGVLAFVRSLIGKDGSR